MSTTFYVREPEYKRNMSTTNALEVGDIFKFVNGNGDWHIVANNIDNERLIVNLLTLRTVTMLGLKQDVIIPDPGTRFTYEVKST